MLMLKVLMIVVRLVEKLMRFQKIFALRFLIRFFI